MRKLCSSYVVASVACLVGGCSAGPAFQPPPSNRDVGATESAVVVDPLLTQEAKLVTSNGANNDHVGWSVAVSGDTAVVGAPYSGWCGNQCVQGGRPGAAYVFTRGSAGWVQQQELVPASGIDGNQFPFFGNAVALEGDTVVVGAYAQHSGGAAYVFVRNGTTWLEQQELHPQDGAVNFGYAVAMSGDTALVGAYGFLSNNNAGAPGAAYVFTRTGSAWSQQQKLNASDGVSNDQFGRAVALSGNTAAIGAPGRAHDAGAAYVFVRAGASWQQEQSLVASDSQPNEALGWSIAVLGDTTVAGAVGKGAAYVFARSGTSWSERQQLKSSDAGFYAGDNFGWSLALGSETLLIGAWGAANQPGATYTFIPSITGWQQNQKLAAADAAANDQFGWSVAVSTDAALVGAPAPVRSPGAAYAFVAPATNQPPVCDAAEPSVREVWPPNGRQVGVDIQKVTDADGDPIELTITSIKQDEPLAAGKRCTEATGVGTASATVRATRDGNGSGRVYHISFAATDSSGASCAGDVSVCVPHDNGTGQQCVDEGPTYDSTSCQ